MLGTNWVGGGTTTKALAFSKVVRTRLNAWPDALCVICCGAVVLDTCMASRADGDVERDGTVHDDVVEEIEL